MTATTPRKRRAAATPAAEPAQPLADRILAAIASAHSRKPANADDVLAVIGGDAPDFWRAVEQLKDECRINAATIKTQLDAAPWMAIWPTGTPVAHRTWKDLNAAGAFATLPAACMPKRMPTTPDLERDPRPDLRKITREAEGKIVPISADQRRDRIAQLAAGRTLANGIKFADVAADLGISVEGVRYLTKRMGEGNRIAVGLLGTELAHRIYDPAAELADYVSLVREGDMAAEQPAADIDLTAAAAPTAKPCGACADGCQGTECRLIKDSPPIHADRVTFALWDDGGLSIYDGDDLLQLPPADTARLARLLGVPGNPVPAQEQRA